MTHRITVGPSVATITDRNGIASELPKPRSGGHRARCTCGWRSEEAATEAQATTWGNAHVRLSHRDLSAGARDA